MKKFTWIDVLIVALFLLSVYFILTRIFGDSASDLTIVFTLFSLLAVALYKLNREFGEMNVGVMHSFNKVKDDMTLLKKNINLIKNNINLIKKKLKI